MKILVICQYYYPEPFRINDICEEMVKRGHEVTVVTGEPNYPEGQIYKGYENHAHADEIINGVKVHRCPIIPRKTGALYRFLNYFSYPHLAKKYIKNLPASDGKPFDVVFVNQLSPVMMADPAIRYKKKYGVPVLIYCLDLWPESLVAGGIKRNSVVYKLFHRVSKKIYKSADKIFITSKSFAQYFEDEFGITETEYLPQYAESIFTPKECRKKPNGTVDLMFAGNIGAAQSVKTIIEAAHLLRDEPNLRWHIVGDGAELESVKRLSKKYDLKSVTFYGRQPVENMPEYYAMADAMLVTMRQDPVLSWTLPGKVQSYMAAGKPIIGAIDGETQSIIEEAQCGICGNAENASALADNVRTFIYEDKVRLGANAREYYNKHFEKKLFIDEIERLMP